jgi:predicted DNA-binding transcriptional regulator YafY
VTKRIKVDMEYSDDANKPSRRIIRPLGLDFWGKIWTLATWCELRNDFRHFRLDRITLCVPTGQVFAEQPDESLERFLELTTKRRA